MKKCEKHKVEAIKKGNLDVLYAQSRNPPMLNKDDIDKAIVSLFNDIKERFDENKVLAIIGDKELMPDSLNELWYGSGINGLAYWNLDYNFSMYKCGKLDAYEFFDQLESLFDAFLKDIDEIEELLFTGRIERKDEEYERS